MGFETPITYINGCLQSGLSVYDRGLNYGHGLFETLRLSQGQSPFWDYHMARLQSGAKALGIVLQPAVLAEYWRAFVTAVPAQGVVKIIVTAGQGARGYRLGSCDTGTNYLLQWFPLDSEGLAKIGLHCREGVAVKPCRHRLPHNPRLAGIKHLNRLDQVLASKDIDGEQYQEGLVLDCVGNIVEGVSRNVFLRVGTRWLTPDLNRAGVAGVMRRYLLEQVFNRCGLTAAVETVSYQRLGDIEEAFMCNSVGGIWPVVAIEGGGRFEIGDQTRTLQRQLGRDIPCFAI